MLLAAGRAGEDIARRFWVSRDFTRSSARSALLMASGVGSKTDDLKTCLSLKSTAFLQVGPESQNASDAVKHTRMTPYRAETRWLQRSQTLSHVRHHGHFVHVSNSSPKSHRGLQLTVVGNRGTAQLQKTVCADLVTAAQYSTITRSHLCHVFEVPEIVK